MMEDVVSVQLPNAIANENGRYITVEFTTSFLNKYNPKEV